MSFNSQLSTLNPSAIINYHLLIELRSCMELTTEWVVLSINNMILLEKSTCKFNTLLDAWLHHDEFMTTTNLLFISNKANQIISWISLKISWDKSFYATELNTNPYWHHQINDQFLVPLVGSKLWHPQRERERWKRKRLRVKIISLVIFPFCLQVMTYDNKWEGGKFKPMLFLFWSNSVILTTKSTLIVLS